MSIGAVVGIDPEVTAKARRRSVTAAYKQQVMAVELPPRSERAGTLQ